MHSARGEAPASGQSMNDRNKGAVAAGHEITAKAMREILRDGGNAFDAVLAGAMAACVAEPVLASPGGGGFLMARSGADGRLTLYDFFAHTPRRKRPAAETEFFPIIANFGTATQEFHIGAGSTAAPGFAQGVDLIHRELGHLPLERIAEPAIMAARQGVRVSDFQAYLATIISPILTTKPSARALFAPGGALRKGGELMVNAGLGDTFEALAREGARLFTEGEIGQAIVRQSAEDGGHLTLEDLLHYQVRKRRPLMRRFGDFDVALNPPPSMGGTLIGLALAILDRLPAGAAGPDPVDMAEALHQCDAARRGAGHCLEALSSEQTLQDCLEKARRQPQAPRGTTHVSAVDRQGNLAALTLSNGEGNGTMLGRFGFMLNNMLGEEDLNPEGFHLWPEDRRMASMMSPTLLLGADGTMSALGSGGSNRIRSAVFQVTARIANGEEPDQAITAPRFHAEHGHLDMECGLDEDVLDRLKSRFPDHRVWAEQSMFFGGVHMAGQNAAGQFFASGDPRRAGTGYIAQL